MSRETVEPGVWRVKVVCTDSGQHSRAKLGAMYWWNGGFSVDKDGVEEFDRPNARTVGTDGRSTVRTASFSCVRCGREFLLTRDRALRLADALSTRRVSRVDISLLA